jgi:RimJ/RimL family protein N-acetyltransferase
VEGLGDPAARAALAAAGPRQVDGYGAFRARDALAAAFAGRPAPRRVRYRPATPEDAGLLLDWRNDPHVRALSFSSDPITPEQHRAWLAGVLADRDRTLLVAEQAGAAVGTLRFDRSAARAQISITVGPDARGRGLGTQMIAEATELQLAAHPGLADVLAEVQARNLPSLKAFERAGYLPAPAGAPGGRGTTLVRARSSPHSAEREQELS